MIKVEPQNCSYSWVAAVVNKETVEVLLNVGNENEHVMCFMVMTGGTEFIIINMYCQYSAPFRGFIGKFQSLLDEFRTEKS